MMLHFLLQQFHFHLVSKGELCDGMGAYRSSIRYGAVGKAVFKATFIDGLA